MLTIWLTWNAVSFPLRYPKVIGCNLWMHHDRCTHKQEGNNFTTDLNHWEASNEWVSYLNSANQQTSSFIQCKFALESLDGLNHWRVCVFSLLKSCKRCNIIIHNHHLHHLKSWIYYLFICFIKIEPHQRNEFVTSSMAKPLFVFCTN